MMVEIPETVVVVTEPFEGVAVERWSRLIADAADLHPRRLIVDLSDCPLVDAAAVMVLLRTHRAVMRENGRLTLRAPGDRVRRIFTLARVDQVFDIEEPQPA
jgi:anti-anti-sigma factor